MRHKIVWRTEGHAFVGKRLRQHFTGHGDVLGTITKWVPQEGNDPAMFHAVHDDGDEEDLDSRGAAKGIQAYELMVAKKNRVRGARRQARHESDYGSDEGGDSADSNYSHGGGGSSSSSDEDDDEDDDDNQTNDRQSNTRKRKKKTKTKTKTKKKTKTTMTQKKKKKKKKTNKGGTNRAKRMSIEDIHIFLRRLVYCLEKGKVNMTEHPRHHEMVQQCAESQRDEFAIAPNTKVVVLGLQSEKGMKLNGTCGVVVYLDTRTAPERYVVRLEAREGEEGGGTWHRFRPINVKQIPNRGVTIWGIKSKPEINEMSAQVVEWRKDGKFVVKVGMNSYLALRPEKLLLPPGTAVVLHSLKSTALNGVRGCLVAFEKQTGRYTVRIPAQDPAQDEMKTVAVKPVNVWC